MCLEKSSDPGKPGFRGFLVQGPVADDRKVSCGRGDAGTYSRGRRVRRAVEKRLGTDLRGLTGGGHEELPRGSVRDPGAEV